MTERLPAPVRDKFPELDDGFVRTLDAGTLIGRIHFMGSETPAPWNSMRRYGPTTNRFDHHLPPRRIHQVRAIMYGAPVVKDADGNAIRPLDTCLVEVFREATGVVDVKTNEPYFCLFRLRRAIRVLDLIDSNWVTKAGGNAAISSGSRARSREWSRLIYAHYPASAVDGLFYGCSSMPRGRSIALYERGRDALPAHPELDLPLSHLGLRADIEDACSALGLDVVSSSC